MKRSTNKKNIVSPNNKDINFYHFLIEMTCPEAGPIGAVIITQAYTGNMTDSREQAMFNAVEYSCYHNEQKSGIRHAIRACGSREWCLNHAKDLGHSLH
jgi:hypothetical protein